MVVFNIPVAPINDKAKKHNENLPGMGGVFNVVNLHVYHYAGIGQRSDSVTLKSTMLTLVYFYIIMIVHKCQQSAAQSCSRTFELRVLPFGKTSWAKLLNFISCHLSDVFPLLEGSGKQWLLKIVR